MLLHHQPWRFLVFFIYIIIPFLLPCYSSQSIFPQNIETFYPFSFPFPIQKFNATSSNVISLPHSPPISLPKPEESVQTLPQQNPKKAIVVTVVIATAIATLLLSLSLFFIQRSLLAKRKKEQESQSVENQKVFQRFNGNFNGFILEENGSDVIYWTKAAWRKSKKSLLDKLQNLKNKEEEEEGEEEEEEEEGEEGFRKADHGIQETPLLHRRGSSSTSHLKIGPEIVEAAQIDHSNSEALPWLPPPPLPRRKPPPPPLPSNIRRASHDEVKLKPLHWDKVNTNNVDHSMAWDKINGGSFRFNGDLMEALFGYVATNKKSPPKLRYDGRAQISILDSKRSQSIAIVLKSLTLSRQELLDALIEGQGLEPDILEKLVRIAPNQEEQSQILEYKGDPLKLGDAESFIFHLLKAIPTAFTRLNAMLFISNYKSELLHLMESSQTIEMGCVELQKKGLFMKLLEATLKAGNRMNSGTTRGNAQAFNLNSLLKLSDVKSSNGKTTLLHFVVEQVIRSEGKKLFSNTSSKDPISKKERETEYTILGLSVVESLSSEFSNVRKAATIDYKNYITIPLLLSGKISEISEVVSKEGGGGEYYMKKMTGFVKTAEEELKMASKEQRRVMEMVKKTNEYYETGDGNRENPFGLFRIVKDFLRMVDEVCNEIGGNSRKKSKKINPCQPLKSSARMRFPCLSEHLMCSSSIASESRDEDF